MIMEWYCWVGLFSSYALNSGKNKFWLEFCLFETVEFWNVFWLISGSLFYNLSVYCLAWYSLMMLENE
ncbi:hypothetical protein L2E82_21293 [Cichorium intybus]|uniref:Uncharacterized protein n=1 Tax=Cichorium intybus TaxID=13427 RepID=A0ACB9DV50_CICIN|nr:hypothetical protein L2E82_21293 [Cichorium intybus]